MLVPRTLDLIIVKSSVGLTSPTSQSFGRKCPEVLGLRSHFHVSLQVGTLTLFIAQERGSQDVGCFGLWSSAPELAA